MSSVTDISLVICATVEHVAISDVRKAGLASRKLNVLFGDLGSDMRCDALGLEI
jgi:hypothetical protein